MASFVVQKFELPLGRNVTVDLPMGSRLLHVGIQEEGLFIWAFVDPERPKEPRSFTVIRTGDPISWQAATFHIGTVICNAWVWHVFNGKW